MISVSLVYSAKIDAPTGASAVIRNIANCKDLLNDNGINMSIVTSNKIDKSVSIELRKDIETGFYKRIVRRIKIFASNHTLGAVIVIMFQNLRNKIIRKYLLKNPHDDIVFFHELFTCYKFIKKRKIKDSKIVLVLHTNGDTFSMFREYYKTLETSFLYKHLLRIERRVLHEVDKVGFAESILYIGNVYYNKREMALARDKANEAKKIASEIGNKLIQSDCESLIFDLDNFSE